MTTLETLRRLCEADGVSGDEGAASKAAAELLAAYTSDVKIDDFGSVIANIPAEDPNAPLLLLDAHIDQIGMIVTHITDEAHHRHRWHASAPSDLRGGHQKGGGDGRGRHRHRLFQRGAAPVGGARRPGHLCQRFYRAPERAGHLPVFGRPGRGGVHPQCAGAVARQAHGLFSGGGLLLSGGNRPLRGGFHLLPGEAGRRHCGTNADEITVTAGGIRTALLSIPLKYMHTPVEVVQVSDVEAVGNLIAQYVLSCGE